MGRGKTCVLITLLCEGMKKIQYTSLTVASVRSLSLIQLDKNK